MALTKNSKGPYRASIFGYRFGGGPSRVLDTVTQARDYAESFGDTARDCVIFDRTGKSIAQHSRASGVWARVV